MVFSKVNPFPPVSQVYASQEYFNDDAAEEHLQNAQPPVPPEIEKLIEEADTSLIHEDDDYLQEGMDEEAMYDDMEGGDFYDQGDEYYDDENYETMQELS